MTEGRKDDNDKLRYDLEPQDARAGKVAVLTDGAKRYGVRNWEAGMEWGRVYAALQRHMAAWWGGETTDPDSGRPHLDHAACCLDFLSAYEKRGIGTDDRPKVTVEAAVNGTACKAYSVGQYPLVGAVRRKLHCPDCEEIFWDGETKPCERLDPAGIGPEWVRNGGEGQIPASSDFSVDWRRWDGKMFRNIRAGDLRWDEHVTHWRVAEVDGWKPWGGGDCPLVTVGRIDVILRKGEIFKRTGVGSSLSWAHDGTGGDIVGYRYARDE